jgi:hypothetical protein
MKPYKKRLRIPVEPELIDVDGEMLPIGREKNFYTKTGLLVATAYRRVVIGGRGPYVEFHFTDIKWSEFYVPSDLQYRADSKVVYYEEWRSLDSAYVKLYRQKRTVAYADYKVHMNYISPFDLFTDGLTPVII